MHNKEYTVFVIIDFDDDFKLSNNKLKLSKEYNIVAENSKDFNEQLFKSVSKDLKPENFSYINPSKSVNYLTDTLKMTLEQSDTINELAASSRGNYEVDIDIISIKPIKDKKRRLNII